MSGAPKPRPEPSEIGLRARTIRRRRGLSLDVVAGMAGISKPYLSMLERGLRGFERRGLLEDLARALGCSVVDLTGQPYLPGDRDSAEALAADLGRAVRRDSGRRAGPAGPAGRQVGALGGAGKRARRQQPLRGRRAGAGYVAG